MPEELDQLFDNYYLLFVRNYDDSRHRHEAQRKYSALYRERNALIVNILFNQGTSTSEIEKIEMDDIDLIKATQIGLFIHYLQNIRPKLLEYQTAESDKLFFNFQQVRASVITFWIKTQGLRKAQYLARHRYICTTEKYVGNDLENLTEEINKLHPFL